MKRLLEFLYELLEYWRISRIEKKAGVKFWVGDGEGNEKHRLDDRIKIWLQKSTL